MTRLLFIGDVVGKPGRKAVGEFLSRLAGKRDVDLVIANGENAAGGVGVARAAFEIALEYAIVGSSIRSNSAFPRS